MADSTIARLGSAHLEDLAIVALTASIVSPPPSHPALAEAARSKLRARLKQFSRFGWPANAEEDPQIRRGYTLRQCCRLIVALLMADADFPPSDLVPLAREHELGFLQAMIPAMAGIRQAGGLMRTDGDLIAIVLRGDLTGLVAAAAWEEANPNRLRFVRRNEMGSNWATRPDIRLPGQYQTLEIADAARAAWYWLSERDLLPEEALEQLIEVAAADGVQSADPATE